MKALTARHREVLVLVALGLPQRAIAARLGISLGVVRKHVAELCRRLGARNRAHAVAVAFRAGVLT